MPKEILKIHMHSILKAVQSTPLNYFVISFTSAAVLKAERTLRRMWLGQYCVNKIFGNFFMIRDVGEN